jgi:hypothetical protein
MSAKQRSAIENAIWLCGTHAKQVDGDTTTFTVAELLDMKRVAEETALRGLGVQVASAPAAILHFQAVQPRPHVDWTNFYVLPTDAGPRSNTFLCLIAVPARPLRVEIDGPSLETFSANIKAAFGNEPRPPSTPPRAYCHDLAWRNPFGSITRHWRQGQDGSLGFATTVASAFDTERVSLWETAIDCLQFVRFVKDNLAGADVVLDLNFQPGTLAPTAAPLAPQDARKARLAGIPALTPADPNSLFDSVQEPFSAADLRSPCVLLARMLCARWRVMFNATAVSPAVLAEHLRRLAESELGWKV